MKKILLDIPVNWFFKINMRKLIVLTLFLMFITIAHGEENITFNFDTSEENMKFCEDVVVYSKIEINNKTYENIAKPIPVEYEVDEEFNDVIIIIGKPVSYNFYSYYNCRFGYCGFKFTI